MCVSKQDAGEKEQERRCDLSAVMIYCKLYVLYDRETNVFPCCDRLMRMDGWMDGCITTSLASNGHIEVIHDLTISACCIMINC